MRTSLAAALVAAAAVAVVTAKSMPPELVVAAHANFTRARALQTAPEGTVLLFRAYGVALPSTNHRLLSSLHVRFLGAGTE